VKKTPSKKFAASVHQRLLNVARETGRPFNEVLQYFAMERLLYRLSHSDHKGSFVLKGALLFRVWDVPDSRATRDIDFLAFLDNSPETLAAICRDVPETVVAEKAEAMVHLGNLNSRMKDFYDIWRLSQQFEFNNSVLGEAIRQTFDNRGTEVIPFGELTAELLEN